MVSWLECHLSVVCKRCRGRGAKSDCSTHVHVGLNTRDPQGRSLIDSVSWNSRSVFNTAWWTCVCVNAAVSSIMSDTYDCSGLRVRNEQQAKPGLIK